MTSLFALSHPHHKKSYMVLHETTYEIDEHAPYCYLLSPRQALLDYCYQAKHNNNINIIMLPRFDQKSARPGPYQAAQPLSGAPAGSLISLKP
jgi:hypothetical protein